MAGGENVARVRDGKNGYSRREFARELSRWGAALGMCSVMSSVLGRRAEGQVATMTTAKEVDINSPNVVPVKAKYYKTVDEKAIRCFICARNCYLPEGKTCHCYTHINRDGKLYTTAWNNPCILQPDPIEQGPLHHFYPGTRALYVATAGCMLRCLYCQNWQISQATPFDVRVLGTDLDAKKVVHLCKTAHEKYQLSEPIDTIAFSYTDPIAFYEYMTSIAKEAKKNKLKTVMVSSAYIRPSALKDILPYIDAFCFTLKGFTNEFYDKVCGATLEPVQEAMRIVVKAGKWLEIPILLVPGYNDDMELVRAMTRWIVQELGDTVPVHYARFFPKYKMRHLQQTPVKTLKMAYQIAKEEGVKYPYIANLPGCDEGNTYCHNCGATIVRRLGVKVLEINFKNGRCKKCKTKIPGILGKG